MIDTQQRLRCPPRGVGSVIGTMYRFFMPMALLPLLLLLLAICIGQGHEAQETPTCDLQDSWGCPSQMMESTSLSQDWQDSQVSSGSLLQRREELNLEAFAEAVERVEEVEGVEGVEGVKGVKGAEGVDIEAGGRRRRKRRGKGKKGKGGRRRRAGPTPAPSPSRSTPSPSPSTPSPSPATPSPSPSTPSSSPADKVSVTLDWETGTVDSGLAAPLKPSFSENKNGWTPPKDPQGKDCKDGKVKAKDCWPKSVGEKYVGTALHYLSVEKVSWAKDGIHVLKCYADGRNYNKGGKWAFRSEISAVQDKYLFHEGDYQRFSMNFWLDKTWDQVQKWSTLIAQWKMSPGHPHAAVRLSNEGDYKLYFKGDVLWKNTGPKDTKHGGRFLGYAKRQAWNQIDIFFKKSRKNDGFAKVWLNGKEVFEHKGKTLLKSGRGYTKLGMYTNIMDERIIYFDAVKFCHSASKDACSSTVPSA